MEEKKQFNFRDRKFEFILYPEDKSHLLALDKIRQVFKHVGILHDNDKTPDGQPKKPHYHIIVYGFSNPIWASSLCETLGVEINCVTRVRKMRSALRYLIHLDDQSKEQYDDSKVFGSSSALQDFKYAIADELDIYEALKSIFLFIDDNFNFISPALVAKFCLDSGIIKQYRSYYLIIKDYLYEHNCRYSSAVNCFNDSKMWLDSLYDKNN